MRKCENCYYYECGAETHPRTGLPLKALERCRIQRFKHRNLPRKRKCMRWFAVGADEVDQYSRKRRHKWEVV